mmetsp:Transcript_19851/g.34881  ORF Transcript_19851/g.34881 Transcript_19851/m.34881 type:complete len:207 (+) Transcript_19851:333-953(+)
MHRDISLARRGSFEFCRQCHSWSLSLNDGLQIQERSVLFPKLLHVLDEFFFCRCTTTFQVSFVIEDTSGRNGLKFREFMIGILKSKEVSSIIGGIGRSVQQTVERGLELFFRIFWVLGTDLVVGIVIVVVTHGIRLGDSFRGGLQLTTLCVLAILKGGLTERRRACGRTTDHGCPRSGCVMIVTGWKGSENCQHKERNPMTTNRGK